LRYNGLFLFDLNLEPGYIAQWNGVYGIIEEDHVCIIRNSYNPENKLAVFEATLFRLEDEWTRADFILRQRPHPEIEVRGILEQVGFKGTKAYAFSRERGVTGLADDSDRAFFLCRKSTRDS
jgi:hypothetical protein